VCAGSCAGCSSLRAIITNSGSENGGLPSRLACGVIVSLRRSVSTQNSLSVIGMTVISGSYIVWVRSAFLLMPGLVLCAMRLVSVRSPKPG
jgi:hypothetical protein